MFARSLTLASALVAATMAQSTSVTSLFLYGQEGDNLQASVMAVSPGATTYFIHCAEGTDSNDCGLGQGATFVEGPSTFAQHATESGAYTVDVACDIASGTMTCVETFAGPEANDPGTTTGVETDLTDDTLQVTITAGLDLLRAAATASATASSGSATSGTAQPSSSASSGPAETGSAAASSASSSSATSAASAAKTSASAAGSSAASGGAPRVDGKMVGVAGAVAGLFGLVMAL